MADLGTELREAGAVGAAGGEAGPGQGQDALLPGADPADAPVEHRAPRGDDAELGDRG